MISSKFGDYLESLRKSRNYRSISSYLHDYKLPISEGYYRKLESNEALPSLDTARALYKALQTDPFVFYRYLLKNILPPHAAELLTPITAETSDDRQFEPSLKHIDLAEDNIDTYKLNEAAITYFKAHPDLLPVIIYIYSYDNAGLTESKLAKFLSTNAIEIDCRTIISNLLNLKVVTVSVAPDGTRRIVKLKSYLDLNDPDLDQFYLRSECRDDNKPALKLPIKDKSMSGAWYFFAVNPRDYDVIKTQIAAIGNELSFLSDSSEDSEPDETLPLFFWSIVSPRPDWSAE